MAKLYGYDGGDSEAELIKAANATLAEDQADSVEKIKMVYWKLGAILTTAIARGYTKALGARGWIGTRLDCSHTHGYNCKRSWECRHEFDAALEWYRNGNTGFRPKSETGPLFAVELVKAYKARGTSELDALATETKKKTAASKKELVGQLSAWKSRYTRLRDETRKLAQYAKREPLVLNSIEAEIAAEESGVQPKLVKSALHSGITTVPSPRLKTKPTAKRVSRSAKKQPAPAQYGHLLEGDERSDPAVAS